MLCEYHLKTPRKPYKVEISIVLALQVKKLNHLAKAPNCKKKS